MGHGRVQGMDGYESYMRGWVVIGSYCNGRKLECKRE